MVSKLEDSFGSKYKIGLNGCWNWLPYKNKKGYGHAFFKGRKCLAHRVSYEIHIGSIEKGNVVMHYCDNPSCVNPDHLTQGSHQDNVNDRETKGRSAKSKNGEENIFAVLNGFQVRVIKKLLANSGLSQKDIADPFGIHKSTVSLINTNKTWSNL